MIYVKHLLTEIIFIVVGLISNYTVAAPISTVKIGNARWQAIINRADGRLVNYSQLVKNKWEVVPFRTDSMGGFSYEGVTMHCSEKDSLFYEGEKKNIIYRIKYIKGTDHLIVQCSVTNKRQNIYTPQRLRLRIGVNSEMCTYPEWNEKFFPTLMRCEKNFAWGYFMSPRQIVFAWGVEQPVASYGLNYIYEGIKKWKWGHQILTASLDLLHCLPLPIRHPQNYTSLKPGETKIWTLHIGAIKDLSVLKNNLSKWIKAPMIDAERYTLCSGESTKTTIYSPLKIKKAIIKYPNGNSTFLSVEKTKKDVYRLRLPFFNKEGVYRLNVLTANGKNTEGMFYVRMPWSWYLKKTRDFIAENPPFLGSACEQFYGYYPAFLAAQYFPDKQKDNALEERLTRTIALFIDTLRGTPSSIDVLPNRVQNFSSIAGILVNLWKATGKIKYIKWASRIGNYLCSDSIQWSDGSYRSKKTYYTAVIYPAKSMFELSETEHILAAKDSTWEKLYERHRNSAIRASKDLARFLDDIKTEGDMTFEDGMITCSALQMGLCGLKVKNTNIRDSLMSAARYMMNKHQCLEQNMIPDCRMHGATLRFWEALDIYFSPNQVMNSPHGWTAWKIYADYYLYLLTGEEHYLNDFMDTLGTCVQVMNLSGHVRWGFIPDPYVDGRICVPQKNNPHDKQLKDSVVGEQYLEMISPWLRPNNEYSLCFFGGRGGAGDNTVYEIFKAMEECALRSAYVIVEKDGEVKTWNCKARWNKYGNLYVTPNEKTISGIHLNCGHSINIETILSGRKIIKHHFTGLDWLGKKPWLISN